MLHWRVFLAFICCWHTHLNRVEARVEAVPDSFGECSETNVFKIDLLRIFLVRIICKLRVCSTWVLRHLMLRLLQLRYWMVVVLLDWHHFCRISSGSSHLIGFLGLSLFVVRELVFIYTFVCFWKDKFARGFGWVKMFVSFHEVLHRCSISPYFICLYLSQVNPFRKQLFLFWFGHSKTAILKVHL